MITPEVIIKGNAALSVYMGSSARKQDITKSWSIATYTPILVSYDGSWDAIMEVVDKIESEKLILIGGDDECRYEVWIDGEDCSVEWFTNNATGTLVTGDSKITPKKLRVWNMLVEFVEWRNFHAEK